ncbi:GGDEF domain-containing protein [Mycolicibacterium sp. BiH015]|uniref:GGDEF domain-containing protein n=1 Tax=Mycolicibacterium sp. BiH015 TaxID=3018808 RepID=UPI0022E12D64|nr:GGDEF domain-containing protein [Mycolicibacterium sp. BiH015]MDA2893376.1 GGDEF domain-containing protein [Mycolicibacterium sp. BiH015]
MSKRLAVTEMALMTRSHSAIGHYEWLSSSLESRGVAKAARLFIAATWLFMAGAVFVLLTGPEGPKGQPGVAMMVLAIAGGFGGAAIWLRRWPTYRQSLVFAALTAGSIILACLAYPNPLAALLGCITFTTISGYVALFHSTRTLLVLGGAFAVLTAWQAVRLAIAGHVALAVVDLLLVLQANAAVMIAFHALIRTYKGDLAEANHDPLTGLLNRRAFRRETHRLLMRAQEVGAYLVIAMVDLDKFKALNDQYGHPAGDQALIAVAEELRRSTSATAIVCRSGGEEFLIADVISSAGALSRFQDVCDAIANLRLPVTASLGTACVQLGSISATMADTALDRLISAADFAMYRAKRDGGNRCGHHGVVSVATFDRRTM